ncbi:U1 small nuclear ribonucleoprotein C-like [Leptopilina boulardi]|uniref:U1 small nuclear ribonucleoprotein C-like n=1 Tax=Leptopilina boulardi TaxID=63433 RepID=UPI0021F66743|nr:U1 small nuclear ribonucleoprotein C-like [Leptopilina boulardi]
MPKYYCDYCDTYLTHDSPSVRKTHCQGRKHKDNVKYFYQKWMEEQAQQLIDATTAAFKAGKIASNPFATNKGVAIPPPPNLVPRPGPGVVPQQGPPMMPPPGIHHHHHPGPPMMMGPMPPMMGRPPMMPPMGPIGHMMGPMGHMRPSPMTAPMPMKK